MPLARVSLPKVRMLLGPIGEPGLAPLFDLGMMVILYRRERSPAECAQLLESAGLRNTNMQTKRPLMILEATAA